MKYRQALILLMLTILLSGCNTPSRQQKSADKSFSDEPGQEPVHEVQVTEDKGDALLMPKKVSASTLRSHSYLNENDVGKIFNIEGLLQGAEGQWTVIENPESRSRVTFILETPLELQSTMHVLNNKSVLIRGVLIEASAVWTKKLKVIEISNPQE